MADTKRKESEPVPWVKWNGNPLVPRSDYLAAVAGWKRASELLDAAVDDYNAEHDRLTAAEAKIAEQAAEIERLKAATEIESFTPWIRAWCRRRFGVWITHNTAKGALADFRAALAEIGSGK